MKKIRFIILLCLLAALVVGCGEKHPFDLTWEQIEQAEHIILSQEVDDHKDGELPLDEFGFYPVSDMVYVVSDTLNLRMEPNAESEILATVTYGTELSRTGNGTSGWDRIYYEDQTAYVTKDYITTLVIQEKQTFEFSQAMLNVVDTSRQLYSYTSMCDDLQELRSKYPDHMKLGIIGTTADNRNIFEVTLGNPEAKRHITIVGSVCGTEYMSALVCMKQIEYYLTFYDTGNFKGFLYNDLFDNIAIHIIPMLNPDGATISQEYLTCVQSISIKMELEEWFRRDQANGGTNLKLENYLMFFYANANGVDIRNNFDYRFDTAGTVTEPSSQGYKGVTANSEAETKAVLHSLEYWNSDLLIVYHTSGSKINYNYGQSGDTLTLSKTFADALAEYMNYDVSDESVSGDGSMEAYANNVLNIPALSVSLGNGATPLSLNEFSAIWNACRDSWAGMQREVFD